MATRSGRADAGNVTLGSALGIVFLMLAAIALVGPLSDEIERVDDPDGNDSTNDGNVSNSATGIMDLWPLFIALLALGAVAVVLSRAFNGGD